MRFPHCLNRARHDRRILRKPAAVLIGATEKMIEIWTAFLRKTGCLLARFGSEENALAALVTTQLVAPAKPESGNSFTFPRPRCVRRYHKQPIYLLAVDRSPCHATTQRPLAVTLQVVSIVLFTFIGYLNIGIPLAVLPGYVHSDLGFGAVIAGLVISVQYLATLLSRPYAGKIIDNQGSKRAVMIGLAGCGSAACSC
jgi:hypothetical protein